MIKPISIIVCAMTLAFLQASLSGCARTPAPGASDVFLVISIDALRPDALSPERTPNINVLISRGFFTEGRSVNPPKTLIAHTALFTGLSPEQSGKTDNSWHEGEEQVKVPTIFTTARSTGLVTGYFYSKTKLGYLVNGAIKKHELSEDYSIDTALDFIRSNKNTFVFLHVSGLEYKGMEHGWMSKEYIDELSSIDKKLQPLISTASADSKKCIIIITSDHGGHGKLHGTEHRDDYRIPLVIYSNHTKIPEIQKYRIIDLKDIIEKMINPK